MEKSVFFFQNYCSFKNNCIFQLKSLLEIPNFTNFVVFSLLSILSQKSNKSKPIKSDSVQVFLIFNQLSVPAQPSLSTRIFSPLDLHPLPTAPSTSQVRN